MTSGTTCNAETMTDTDTDNVQETEIRIECPVCKDIPSRPLFFHDCGHTLCTVCMIRIDIEAHNREQPVENSPVYRCPECRTATLLPWSRRKRNHALHGLLQCLPGNVARQIDTEREINELLAKHPYCQEVDPGSGNLAHMAQGHRKERVETMVEEITPLVYEAAMSGLAKVVVVSQARLLYTFAKEISVALFPRGIHSIYSTPREFTVYILPPDEGEWENSFVNPNFSIA